METTTTQADSALPHHSLTIAAAAAVAYALLAALWLMFWDEYLSSAPILARLAETGPYSSLKDWLFVGVTSIGIFVVLSLLLPKAPLFLFPAPVPGDAVEGDGFPVLRTTVLVFAVLTVTICISALLNYQAFRNRIIESEKRQVHSITLLKRNQLSHWSAEHAQDLAAVTENSFIVQDLYAWLIDAAGKGAPPERLAERLSVLKRLQGYRSLWVVDGKGQSHLISGGAAAQELPELGRRLVTAALRNGVFVEGAKPDPAAQSLEIGIATPFLRKSQHPPTAFAAIYAELDPNRHLQPILSSWPVPSDTAEVLLVQMQSGEATYLKGQLPRTGRTAKSLTETGAILQQLRSDKTFSDNEIMDSQGNQLIVAAEQVPGTPWVVVGTKKLSETLRPLTDLAIWSGAVIVFVLGAGAWLMLFVGRYQNALRRLANQERRAVSQHYDYLAQFANDLIVLADETGRIVELNDRALTVTGYSRESLLHMNVREVISPDVLAAFDRDIASVGPEGSIFETSCLTKNGLGIPVEVSARLIEVDGRRFRQGIVRDISERKQAEARSAALVELSRQAPDLDEPALLKRGVEAMQQLTQSRIAFLHFVTPDQNQIELVFWSDATSAHDREPDSDSYYPVAQAGLWADSIRQKKVVLVNDFSAVPDGRGLPQGHAALRRLISVPVLEGPLVRMIVGVGNADTDYRQSDVDTVTIFADDLYVMVLRKRAEDELREAAAQFRSLVEQSIAGIYIVQDDKFAYVNPRFAEIYGYTSADNLVGVDCLSLIADEDREAVANDYRDMITAQKPGIARNFHAKRKDGVAIEIGMQTKPIIYQGQSAIMGMIQDVSEKARAELQIRHYIEQIEAAFMSTVTVLMTMGEMRDPYTAGHQRRVAEIAVAIGGEMGLEASRLEGLRVGGYLHDIGKIRIPAEILSKPGKLSANEFQLVGEHPQSGYDILKGVQFPWPVAEVALQHHERFDGTGYPQGLIGDAIVLEARIIAVADVVEAMASHRPYRPSLGIPAALAEIQRGRGTSYDPKVVDAALNLFVEKNYQIPR